MKTTLTLILLFTLLHSCNSAVDKKNFNSVGKTIVEAIQNKDKKTIIDLFGTNWSNEQEEFFFASVFELAQANSPFKYLRTDTSSFEINGFTRKYLSVYFKFANDSNTHYYEAGSEYEIDSEGNIQISQLSTRDLTARCKETKEMPEGALTTEYRLEQLKGKSPGEFYLFIRNGNTCEIDSLVFKVSLANKNKDKNLNFEKTFTIKQKIEPFKEIKLTLPYINQTLNTSNISWTDLRFNTLYPVFCLKDCDKVAELKSIK